MTQKKESKRIKKTKILVTFFRCLIILNIISVHIPFLKERKEDIVMLLHYYLKKFNEKYKTNKAFHPASLEILTTFDWPGNIRELQNLVVKLYLQ